MEFDTFKSLVSSALLQIAQKDSFLLSKSGTERCLTSKLTAYLDTLLQEQGLIHLRADAELSLTHKPSAIVSQRAVFMPFVFRGDEGWVMTFSRQPKLRLYRTAIPDTVIHDRSGNPDGWVASLEGKLADCSTETREADFSKIVSCISTLGFKHGLYVEFPRTSEQMVAGTLFTKLGLSIGVDFVNLNVSTLNIVPATETQRRNVLLFEARCRARALLLALRRSETVTSVLSSLASPAAQKMVQANHDALSELVVELVAAGASHSELFSVDVPAFLASMKHGDPSEVVLAASLPLSWNKLPEADREAFANSITAQIVNLRQEVEFYASDLTALRKLEASSAL